MDYKHNKWYRLGKVVFLMSTALVTVTAILMALGQDAAILWFFIGCLIMIIGNSIMVSIKYRYQQMADDELTIGERFAGRVYDIKEYFVKKGILGSCLYFLLIASIVCSAVFGIRAASEAYNYSGTWNMGYKYNLSLYEKNSGLANTALGEAESFEAEGKIAEAKRKQREAENYSELAKKNLKDSAESYKAAVRIKPQRDAKLGQFYIVLGINGVVLAAFVTELVLRKQSRGKKV